jgi:hypothetical protein
MLLGVCDDSFQSDGGLCVVLTERGPWDGAPNMLGLRGSFAPAECPYKGDNFMTKG